MRQSYFIFTAKYKRYLLLDLIYKNKTLTQRDIARLINVSLSMVNEYLEEYEIAGYIKREYISKKVVRYNITEKGIEHMRVLNIGYLAEIQRFYNDAKQGIYYFLNQLIEKGYKNMVLYGAGEVAQIILETIKSDKRITLNVVTLIDDDTKKQGLTLVDTKINSIEFINKVEHDCVMISSHANHQKILSNLQRINYPEDKIEYFFNEREE